MFNTVSKFSSIGLAFCSSLAMAESPIQNTYYAKYLSSSVAPSKSVMISRDTLSSNTQNEELNADTLATMTEKDWSEAMTEIGSILLLGRLAYLSGGETIERDFDYELEGNELEYFSKRLFTDEVWKLDDNSKGMNWGHAYAGMIYHQAFRNHNFNYYESVLATFLTSTAWEAFFEYKEVVSINDQFFTTWGGAVLGESFFQINEMLAHKDGWIPYTFEVLFNPAKAIRGWLGAPEKLRFNRSKTSDVFNVYTGLLYSSNDTRDLDVTMLTFGLNASVNSMEGHYDSLSGTPTLVEMNAEFGFSQNGFEDFQLTSTVLLGGYYNRTRTQDEQAWQETFFIGPSVGIEYASFSEDEDEEDFFATVNLLGVTLGHKWKKDALSFSVRADAFGDFAMVRPFASKNVENYRDFYWNSKSALWENAYAYALGHTINLKFEAAYQSFNVGFSARSQRWDSIDNKEYERFGSWNPNRKDLDFKDKRDRYKLYASYDFSTTLTLSLHYEEIHRSGEFFGIDDPSFYAQADDVETRSSLQVSYHY